MQIGWNRRLLVVDINGDEIGVIVNAVTHFCGLPEWAVKDSNLRPWDQESLWRDPVYMPRVRLAVVHPLTPSAYARERRECGFRRA